MLAEEKYRIIYADPPWRYNARNNPDTRFGLGVHGHYPTMALQEICSLSVESISADNSALFLWTTWPRLRFGLQVMKAWGFEYKTVGFVWIKLNQGRASMETDDLAHQMFNSYTWESFLDWFSFFGIGYYTKSNTEVCLLGIKGKMKPISNKVSQLIFYPRLNHSEKPPIVRDRIVELFGDLPRIELFAREEEEIEGWDMWGNEVVSDIELEVKNG